MAPMSPLEERILKANRKIQILEEIHQLTLELFELEKTDVLSDHHSLQDFITMGIDDDIRLAELPKRNNDAPVILNKDLFNDEKFESFEFHI